MTDEVINLNLQFRCFSWKPLSVELKKFAGGELEVRLQYDGKYSPRALLGEDARFELDGELWWGHLYDVTQLPGEARLYFGCCGRVVEQPYTPPDLTCWGFPKPTPLEELKEITPKLEDPSGEAPDAPDDAAIEDAERDLGSPESPAPDLNSEETNHA